MTDIETRLRAAMRSAGEQPPAGLMGAVRARHRRHVRRMTATWAAAAIIAVGAGGPLIARAVQAVSPGRPAPQRPASPASAPVSMSPAAAPGTALAGCDRANTGQIAWQPSTPGRLGASPLWYLSGGHDTAKVELYVGLMVIAGLRPGSIVVINVAPAGQGQLRFLFGPGDSLAHDSPSSETGVTFVACPPDAGFFTEPANVTVYRGGFLVEAGRCVPADIWWTGHPTPVRVGLGACGGSG
jgi:hypothetical protein